MDQWTQWIVAFVPFALGLIDALTEEWRRGPGRGVWYKSLVFVITLAISFGLFFYIHRQIRQAKEDQDRVRKRTTDEVTASVTANVTAAEAKAFAANLEHFEGIERKEDTILSQNDSRAAKKKELLESLDKLYREGQFERGTDCNAVGKPRPGSSYSGGTNPRTCAHTIEVWTAIVTGFLRGTLPPVFGTRFQEAGDVSRIGPSPADIDPEVGGIIDLPMRGMTARLAQLKEFAEEVQSDKVKF